MNIAITGFTGFFAKNLRLYLQAHFPEFKVYELNLREKNVHLPASIDILFHTAAVNRTKGSIIAENEAITCSLMTHLQEIRVKSIVFTNSTHYFRTSDYGESKRMVSDSLRKYCLANNIFYVNCILPNLYGPFGKENYNSVVNTFIYNVQHNISSTIDKSSLIDLVYIDDVFPYIFKALNLTNEKIVDLTFESIQVRKSVLEIFMIVEEIHVKYNRGYIPEIIDAFAWNIYNIYITYLGRKIERELILHSDKRGSFCELTRSLTKGQFSLSTSNPGVVRGDHFHVTKPERFIYVTGGVKISMRNIVGGTTVEFIYTDNVPRTIDIPIGSTHKLENIGEEQLIMYFFTPDFFDQKNPDTYLLNV